MPELRPAEPGRRTLTVALILLAAACGGDGGIEFVLARRDPDGEPTDGIVRIDASAIENPVEGSLFDRYARYGYWDAASYLNVWTLPLPESMVDGFLGLATGPETDLPGAEHLLAGEPLQAEGVLINAAHFGESDLASPHNLGRTLTHEIGHYLGLFHLWGAGDCATNDYCDDTPPAAEPIFACATPPPSGATTSRSWSRTT